MARANHLYLKEAKQACLSALNMLEDLEKELTVAGARAVAIQGQQVAAAMYQLAGGVDQQQSATLLSYPVVADVGQEAVRKMEALKNGKST